MYVIYPKTKTWHFGSIAADTFCIQRTVLRHLFRYLGCNEKIFPKIEIFGGQFFGKLRTLFAIFAMGVIYTIQKQTLLFTTSRNKNISDKWPINTTIAHFRTLVMKNLQNCLNLCLRCIFVGSLHKNQEKSMFL